jgi:hypothetical protein
MMRGLDWIAFNVERALGLRTASPEEATLSADLVPRLLAEVPRHLAVALQAGHVLRP